MIPKERIVLGVQKLILNKVYDNNDFNIITNNETLAIELELSKKTTLTLATIYCPDGKPDRELFRAVTSLWDKVILLGDLIQNTMSLIVPQQQRLVVIQRNCEKAKTDIFK